MKKNQQVDVNSCPYKLPVLTISDGTIEALKWLGLIAMTLDHVNHLLFNLKLPFLSEFGRIALPLFGFVLAYNLARPLALEKGLFLRAMSKMLLYGTIATPFYIYLGATERYGWLPLNIMFTLLISTSIIYLINLGGLYKKILALILFILGGIIVEYSWLGLGYCLTAWLFYKKPSAQYLLLWILSTTSLYLANLNFWALAVIPIIFLSTKVDFKLPRIRSVFYVYYPLHLAVLCITEKWLIA